MLHVQCYMKIYTRTGDDGTTALFGGERLSKADIQIDAYGCLDELTSTIGVLLGHIENNDEISFIDDIQRDLYIIMGFIANAPTDLKKQERKIALFENKIDKLTGRLPPLNNFIIPGGSVVSCWAHMARVNCRKAERAVVLHFQKKKIMKDENSQVVLTYLNRLSDLLFSYARAFNEEKDIISKKS